MKGTKVKLSLYPINKQHRFGRIEFNPNKLGKVGKAILRRMLIELLDRDTVLKLYFNAVVTLLHLTLDTTNLGRNIYPNARQSWNDER